MDSYKGGGGGEVRRINVVYFLSRGGRTDHPHLFRVNHINHAGVRLRDVKRWLSEVRGKDMPGNFSWSYKRKYKAGYVWQDLMDDDLITPVSDNEYVLKGCDVRGTPPPPCSDKPKASSLADEKELNEKGGKDEKVVCDQKQVEEVLMIQVTPDSGGSSPKPPPPIGKDSPGCEHESFTIVLPQILQEQNLQQVQEAKAAAKQAVVARAEGSGSKKHPVGRARRMRVAQVLHSILTCGKADADDAAHRPVLRQMAGAGDDDWSRTPVCPGIDGCGIHVSRKVRLRRGGGGGGKDKAAKRDGVKRDGGGGKDKAAKRDGVKRDGGVAHKPAILPRCSQCGKEFKPQELHSHMQSCRGFRERMKSSAGTGTRIGVERNRSSTARSAKAAAGCSPERRPTANFLCFSPS